MVVDKKKKNQSVAGELIFLKERLGLYYPIIFYVSHFTLLIPIKFIIVI